MSIRRGVYIEEIATAITSPIEADAGFPICFGTAPVHRTADPAAGVGKILIAYRWAEMVGQLGYDDDWSKWTCCEFMYTQAKLYNVSPSAFVNVFDPTKHFVQSEDQILTFTDGKLTLDDLDAILDTVTIVKDNNVGYALGTDYSLSRDDEGRIVVTVIDGGELTSGQTVAVNYHIADPTKVTKTDIIAATELVDTSLPLLGIIPGFLLAPGWSHDSEVGNILEAKVQSMNGDHFNAMAVLDIPTDVCRKYTDTTDWKAANSYISPCDAVCWPMVTLGGKIYHISTHFVGISIKLDGEHDNKPSYSPSNKEMQIDGACLADGTPVALGPEQAEYLNGQGIVTAFRMGVYGWKLWGNYTGAYPTSSDPKDVFISVRRMFNWLGNTFTLTYWQKVDNPMNRILVDNIVTSGDIWLDGLTGDGHLLGGRIIYDPYENPVTQLKNGTIVFHLYATPTIPAQEIRARLEFDTNYLKTLAG